MALFNILKGLYVSVNKRSRGDGRRCEVWKVSVWLLGNRTKHIKPSDKQAVNGFQSGELGCCEIWGIWNLMVFLVSAFVRPYGSLIEGVSVYE